MYFVGPDGQVRDDGWGDWTNAYGRREDGTQWHLPPSDTAALTQAWYRDHPPVAVGGMSPEKVAEIRSRFPIGDVIAGLTSKLGIEPCAPCKRRQAMLNHLGDRVAGALGRR